MKTSLLRAMGLGSLLLASTQTLSAATAPSTPQLSDFDKRQSAAVSEDVDASRAAAAMRLRNNVPGLKVDFDSITRAPKDVSSADGFLTGANGAGRALGPGSLTGFAASDPHRLTKGFLREHKALFGHGPEVLATARITREFVTPHNGMKTVVWQQQVAGVAVFEAVLSSHTTRRDELVKVCSQFLPDVDAAADRGTPNHAAVLANPTVSARQAIALAAQNVGDAAAVEAVTPVAEAAATPERRQKFSATFLRGEGTAQLIWLPMDRDTLRLCWDVTLTSRARGEMFRVLVDAKTGEVLVRRGLTSYLSDASYRVFTSDSPSPFSPGHPTPLTTQPPLVSRTLVTLPALNTNASPAGWLDDGGNETRGNNVDAHTDRNNDDLPDVPRPQGSPFRVFDFAMDLTTQDPTNYSPAAVVQLFYLCNWTHDKLYALGFTEAAGNFQSNNFARGGVGGDAVQADAQDGSGVNNANMSTPGDGFP
ncbi:MAG: hypothetical protein EXS35_15715, partial [Pedosphaera sp.]|nr:hypothetical protein [Pedosphaera sp.]